MPDCNQASRRQHMAIIYFSSSTAFVWALDLAKRVQDHRAVSAGHAIGLQNMGSRAGKPHHAGRRSDVRLHLLPLYATDQISSPCAFQWWRRDHQQQHHSPLRWFSDVDRVDSGDGVVFEPEQNLMKCLFSQRYGSLPPAPSRAGRSDRILAHFGQTPPRLLAEYIFCTSLPWPSGSYAGTSARLLDRRMGGSCPVLLTLARTQPLRKGTITEPGTGTSPFHPRIIAGRYWPRTGRTASGDLELSVQIA